MSRSASSELDIGTRNWLRPLNSELGKTMVYLKLKINWWMLEILTVFILETFGNTMKHRINNVACCNSQHR